MKERLANIQEVEKVFPEDECSKNEKAELSNEINLNASLLPAPLLSLIDGAMTRVGELEPPRGYLGMSAIGTEDERTLWLNFRWSNPEQFTARTRRIFHLGHVLEDVVIDYLKQITVSDAMALGLDRPPGKELNDQLFEINDRQPDGEQLGFADIGGHFSGHLDFMIKGLYESKQWHVGDVKTCKDSKFKEFKKNGMKLTSPTYFGQAQSYMHYTKTERSIYVFYNKDTSEIWFERIAYDHKYFLFLKDKAERIIESPAPPDSSYPNRNYFEIKKFKSEEYQGIYWGDQLPPKAHCRNCRFSKPELTANATWYCDKWESVIPTTQDQLNGCGAHNWIPALVNAELIELKEDRATYKLGASTFDNVSKTEQRQVFQRRND